MGKGDNYRPVDKKRFDENFESVFGKKKLNTWNQNDEAETGAGGGGDGTEQDNQQDASCPAGGLQTDTPSDVPLQEAGSNQESDGPTPTHDPGGF